MRTTIDIPDSLFREIKATAAIRGETLKAFLLRAAKAELSNSEAGMKHRVQLPLVNSKEVSYDVSSERLREIEEEEDIEQFS
ncbi:MAG: hypothetical protein P1U86_10440 [Verrucomicrobiales bacterium]|nr:hypothetical protein [Verrucomicrobiales bacterium]